MFHKKVHAKTNMDILPLALLKKCRLHRTYGSKIYGRCCIIGMVPVANSGPCAWLTVHPAEKNTIPNYIYNSEEFPFIFFGIVCFSWRCTVSHFPSVWTCYGHNSDDEAPSVYRYDQKFRMGKDQCTKSCGSDFFWVLRQEEDNNLSEEALSQ